MVPFEINNGRNQLFFYRGKHVLIKKFFLLITGLLTTGIVLLNYGLPGITVPLAFYDYYRALSLIWVVLIIVLNLLILKSSFTKWVKFSLQLLTFLFILFVNAIAIEYFHRFNDYGPSVSIAVGMVFSVVIIISLVIAWRKLK